MRQEDEEKLRRFNEEWDSSHTSNDIKPQSSTVQNNVPNTDSLLQSVQQSISTRTYIPTEIPTTGNKCGQCGTIHPPLRPGEECPISKSKEEPKRHVMSPACAIPDDPKPVQQLTEGQTQSNIKTVTDGQPRPTSPPPAPKPIAPQVSQPVVPEPEPLAENNIPTEIHVNKYLNNWGEMIQAHCNRYGITNTKKLMRHLTIEITDFLENNKGK